MISFLFLIILAYLVGSIPTGYLIIKFKTGKDIRKFGSGGTGGTNVSRILGGKWGVLVAIIDVLKGTIPTHLAITLLNSYWQIITIATIAILAHIFPVWLNFKAGKGVATLLGTLIAILGGKIMLLFLICWIILLLILRIMSLTNLILVLLLPFIFWIFYFPFAYIIFGIISAVIIWYSHRENIERLREGKEPKFSLKS